VPVSPSRSSQPAHRRGDGARPGDLEKEAPLSGSGRRGPLRVVVDGLPARGTSIGIALQHLLQGWTELGEGDELHVVMPEDGEVELPAGISPVPVALGRRPYLARVRAQSTVIPRLCRSVGADALLAVLPTTTVTPLPCPRIVIAHDLRYELRPEQFARRARVVRKVSYDIGYRQADAIVCVSGRTRDDLLAVHPYLRGRRVHVVHHGADHVHGWARRTGGDPYALAFGQWANKNVDLVLEAWQLLHKRGHDVPLVIVGLPQPFRVHVTARAAQLGLAGKVHPLPWLDSAEFESTFASSALVVFPSDFEGFGLPAVEAMHLGIPLVVSADPALLEVTGGLASVMEGSGAEALADAVERARTAGPADLEAARAHAAAFTWRRAAAEMRAVVLETVAAGERA